MRFPRILCLAIAASLSSLASASGVDAVYYPATGKVVLPNLKVGNLIYYAELNKVPGTNDFRLDLTSINNLSTPPPFTTPALSDLIGTWTSSDSPTSWATLSADGTYTQYQGPKTDPNCPAAGGYETGIWQYEPSTGVFSAVALTDNNGECGFSNPQGIVRMKKVGTAIYFVEGSNPPQQLIVK
ncbi:MAG TPA: hypothetical protein VMH83_11135 [Candidatus Acidoferrum sp.]|nr:hypothetical protein [Candidatus Acidoferrum sp.]